MTVSWILPHLEVRTTPSKTRKRHKIHSLGYQRGPVKYPDRLVAGVLWDCKRMKLTEVSRLWGLGYQLVLHWNDGTTRSHVAPAEWPASLDKRAAVLECRNGKPLETTPPPRTKMHP